MAHSPVTASAPDRPSGALTPRALQSPGFDTACCLRSPCRRSIPREITIENNLSREYYRDMPSDDTGTAQPSAAASAVPELRKVTDTRTLRALAHPVRIALIEELSLGGAMTATEVGERIGESPTTCSFHLRQLAKYGFVEEAGGGRGRARPWRMTSIGMSFSAAAGDGGARIASHAALRLFRERQLARYETWLATRGTYPAQWR